MPRFLMRLLGQDPDREWRLAVMRRENAIAYAARREARKVSNARAKAGAATKIHQQFERDPLINARNQA